MTHPASAWLIRTIGAHLDAILNGATKGWLFAMGAGNDTMITISGIITDDHTLSHEFVEQVEPLP